MFFVIRVLLCLVYFVVVDVCSPRVLFVVVFACVCAVFGFACLCCVGCFVIIIIICVFCFVVVECWLFSPVCVVCCLVVFVRV